MANPRRSVTTRKRRRRLSAEAVRVNVAQPHQVRASRRTFIRLYKPHLSLNPWSDEHARQISLPKFLAAVLTLGLVVGLYQLFNNPMFFVHEVAFSGQRLMPVGELSQASGVRDWNIFFIDGRQVESALLKLPEVKSAQVDVNWPNSVHVQIVERVPHFIWETRGGAYWVGDDAVALSKRKDLPDLWQIKDNDGAAVNLGARVNEAAYNAAATLRNVLPGAPRKLEWSRAHGLAMYGEHGWLVYLGSANQMREKLDALKVVTEEILKARKSVAFIDLGSGQPYLREATR